MFNWQDVNDIYSPSLSEVIKGSTVRLYVEVEGDFEKFETNVFAIEALLTHWSYPTSKGDMSPFKLLDYSKDSYSFAANLQIVKKSKSVDEFKLLCQDVIDVLNMADVHIKRWEVL